MKKIRKEQTLNESLGFDNVQGVGENTYIHKWVKVVYDFFPFTASNNRLIFQVNPFSGNEFSGIRKVGNLDENLLGGSKIWVSSDQGDYTTGPVSIQRSSSYVTFNNNGNQTIEGYNPVSAVGLVLNDCIIYFDTYGVHSDDIIGFLYGDNFKSLEEISIELETHTSYGTRMVIK